MKSKSLKLNVFLNIARVLMSIIFPLITFPYATRVLGTTNLGKVTFGNSVISFLLLLASMGISTYAVREGAPLKKNKEKFEKFSNEVFSLNIIFTLISYVILIILLIFPKFHNYKKLLCLQSAIIILTTIGMEWFYIIKEDYFYITLRTFFVQVISMILMFLFVRDQKDYYIYALISVISTGGAYIINFLNIKKHCNIKFSLHINIKRHIKPILVFFANDLAQQVYINSDVLVLGLLSSDYNVGLYSLSVKIYTIVKQLINAVIKTCIPRLAYLNSKEERKEYIELSKKLMRFIVLIGIPALMGMFLLSEQIILIISGIEYLEANESLKILSFALVFAILSNFFVNAILIINKQERKVLLATIISAVFNLLLNLVLIPKFQQNGAALTTLFAEIIVCFFSFINGKRYIFLSNKIWKDFFQSIAGAIIILLIFTFINYLELSNIIKTITVFILSLISYGLLLIVLKNDLVIQALDKFLKKSKED